MDIPHIDNQNIICIQYKTNIHFNLNRNNSSILYKNNILFLYFLLCILHFI